MLLLHSNIHARSTARGCPGDLRQPASDLALDPSHPTYHFSSAGPTITPWRPRRAEPPAPCSDSSQAPHGGGGRWAQPPLHPPAVRARHAGPTGRPRRSRLTGPQEWHCGRREHENEGHTALSNSGGPSAPSPRPHGRPPPPRGGRAPRRNAAAKAARRHAPARRTRPVPEHATKRPVSQHPPDDDAAPRAPCRGLARARELGRCPPPPPLHPAPRRPHPLPRTHS